jgi:ribosomal protein S18 acetylase RimI-like enzyme
MTTDHVRPFRREETDAVVDLWRRCGLTRPWNDPRRDIERKLSVQPELFLVLERDAVLVATAMAGYDGHRGWVYYLAVEPALQGAGVGRALMVEVEARLLALGCPKVNVQVRGGNEPVAAFYHQLGYAEDGATGFGKRLIPDA